MNLARLKHFFAFFAENFNPSSDGISKLSVKLMETIADEMQTIH